MVLGKFDFSLSAKQTGEGKKGQWGGELLKNVTRSLKPKNILKNPVCSGENFTGGALKVAWTCSVSTTLWLLMFLSLCPVARQLR